VNFTVTVTSGFGKVAHTADGGSNFGLSFSVVKAI
jgi:hypothetical protein